MTMDNTISPARADVARRLDALDETLDRAVRAARRRNVIALVLAIISLCLIAYYLRYAHREFASWDAERVTQYGQAQLVSQMPDAAQELKQSLRQQAPSVIDAGEQRLRELPDRFAETLQKSLEQQLAVRSPEAEEQLYQAMKAGLAEADAHVKDAGGPAASDEERFKTLLDTLAHLYGTQTLKFLDELHGRFQTRSADLIGYLDLLAEGQQLTAQQQSQRTMIRNFLVLAREHHGNSAVTAAGSVSGGPAGASNAASVPPTTRPATSPTTSTTESSANEQRGGR
jgi:hypothetical protein